MISAQEFLALTGAHGPHFATGGHVNADTVPFVHSLLRSLDVPTSPQRDQFRSLVWRDFYYWHLFGDAAAQALLTQVPQLPVSQPLSETSQKVLAEVYSPVHVARAIQEPKAAVTFFDAKLKMLRELCETAEPFRSRIDSARQELRKFRTEHKDLLFRNPPPAEPTANDETSSTEEAQKLASLKDEDQRLSASLAAITDEKTQHSPELVYLANYQKTVEELLKKFGRLDLVEKEIVKLNKAVGRAAGRSGKDMENKAFDLAVKTGELKACLLHAERARDKYDLKALEDLDLQAFLAECDFAAGPDERTRRLERNISEFQDKLIAKRLPHLAILSGVKQQSSFGLAGEFDGVLVDLIDSDVLLVMEVKASPADCVYARSQRIRQERVQAFMNDAKTKKVATPPPGKGEVTKEATAVPQPQHQPTVTFKVSPPACVAHRYQGGRRTPTMQPKDAVGFGKSPPPLGESPPVEREGKTTASGEGEAFLTVRSFETFAKAPVERWVYIMPRHPAPETPPLYSPIVHVAVRELSVLWAAALEQVIQGRHDPGLKLAIMTGDVEARNSVFEEAIAKAVHILPSLALDRLATALTASWSRCVDDSRPSKQRHAAGATFEDDPTFHQPTLGPPQELLAELQQHGCTRNAIFIDAFGRSASTSSSGSN